MTAGPIEEDVFEHTRADTRRRNRHEQPGMMVKCPFDLSIEREEMKGDVYMANKSEKLYIAVPVDDLILQSQIRSVSLY